MIPWYFFALGSTILFAAFAISRKKALEKGHSLEFESARSIAMVLILLFFLPFIEINVSWKILLIIYILSVLSATGIILTSKSFHHSPISKIYPLTSLRLLFILVLSFFFLGERISLNNLIGVLIILAGTYALEADYHHPQDIFEPLKLLFKSKYVFFTVIALFIFSIVGVIFKFLINDNVNPTSLFFLTWIFVAINLNTIHGIKYGFKEVKYFFKKKPLFPFLVAFFSIGANLLYLNSLKYAYISLVSPIIMLSTIIVVFIGGKFFKEKNILYRLIISTTMLIGIYLIII